jgi:DNA invertase Pin-like site-specific DNA recombinase
VGTLLGYSRVSTAGQDVALQDDALSAAGCRKVWTDVASGVRADRPQLGLVLEALQPGNTLVVWRLDRLGRSLPHLVEIVRELEGRGVGFRSLTESIDTTTPGGRLIFHIFGSLAQFSVIWTRRDARLPDVSVHRLLPDAVSTGRGRPVCRWSRNARWRA